MPKVDMAAEEQRIRQLTDSVVAAEVRHDVEGTLAYYAPDVVLQMPGAPAIIGREALRPMIKDFMATERQRIISMNP